uniref:separase n=1 Tax=Albugo laibachii Nc14 TaxID=890382 RepID=F0WLU9_9STRA|nr:separin putative [Albugo laibachii Nc14]|eukprot:CCA22275.1 separin putative [Albugo laibachii Nc14]
MKEQQLLDQFRSKETLSLAYESFVAQIRPHIVSDDAERVKRVSSCKESRQSVKRKLNKLCCHVLKDVYMPNVHWDTNYASGNTRELVQAAVFSAKVTQQILQIYSESSSHDISTIQIHQVISAVCIAQFLLIQCEDQLHFKDLTIEKMLYQVIKLCFERAKCEKTLTRLLYALHIRLWLWHAEASQHSRCTFPETIQSSLGHHSPKDLLIDSIFSIPSFEMVELAPHPRSNVHTFAYSQLVLSLLNLIINVLISSGLAQIYRVGLQYEREGSQASTNKPTKVRDEIINFYQEAINLLSNERSLEQIGAGNVDLMQLLQHMCSICVSNKRLVDAVLVLRYMRTLNSGRHSSSISLALIECLKWMMAASTLELFVSLHSGLVCEHKVEISGAILDGAFDGQPSNVVDAIKDHQQLASCLDCCHSSADELANTLYILTKSKAAKSFLLHAVKKSGLKLYNATIQRNGFIKKDNRMMICKSLLHWSHAIAKLSVKTQHETKEGEQEVFCGQLFLLRVQLFKFAVLMILRQISDELELFYEPLSIDTIDIGAAFTNHATVKCSEAIVYEVKEMVKDAYGAALKFFKSNQKERCVCVLSRFYKLGKSCVDANAEHFSSANENGFETLKLDVVAALLSSCLIPVDAAALLGEVIRYTIPTTNNGSSYLANIHQYLKNVLTVISSEIQNGDENEATSALQKYINDVCLSVSPSLKEQSVGLFVIQALSRTSSDIVNFLRLAKTDQSSEQVVILRACANVLKVMWQRVFVEFAVDWTPLKLDAQIVKLISIRLELVTICGYYYSATKSLEEVIEVCVRTHKSACGLVISFENIKESGTQNKQQSSFLDLCLACALTWKCIVTLKTLMLCSYTNTALSNFAKEYENQISEQSALQDIALSISLFLSGFSEMITGSKRDGYSACFMTECVLPGLEVISKAIFLIGMQSKFKYAICAIWNKAFEHAHLTPEEFVKWQCAFRITPFLFDADDGHDTMELLSLSHAEKSDHEDQIPKNGIFAGILAIDDGIIRCGRYLQTGDFEAFCIALTETAKQLIAIKSDTPVLSRTMDTQKSISMREVLLRFIYCNYQIRRGHARCALHDMKICFLLCSKLARKLSYTGMPKNSNANSLENTLVQRFNAHGEEIDVQTLNMRGESVESTSHASLIYFQAIETIHWDLLVLTTMSMCRLASLHSGICQPKRARRYLTGAIELVGGLEPGWLQRQVLYEYAELHISWDRMLSAQTASQQLSQLVSSPSDEHIYEYISEKLLECDLCLIQSDLHNARRNLTESLRLLHHVKSTDKDDKSRRLSVRCQRTLTLCLTNLLVGEREDNQQIWQELLVSMKQLQTSLEECSDTAEIIRGTCELARANLLLWQSARWKPLLTLDETIDLLENTFVIGAPCGVTSLRREIYLHLGIAYEIKQSIDQSRGKSLYLEANSLAWSAGYFLANVAGTTLVKDCTSEECRIFAENEFREVGATSSDTCVRAGGDAYRSNVNASAPDMPRQCQVRTVHDYVQRTKLRLSKLPSSWLIISLSIDFNDNIMITRLTRDGVPMSYTISNICWRERLNNLQEITEESRHESDTWTKQRKQNWWEVRQDLDNRLAEILKTMENDLNFWNCLLGLDSFHEVELSVRKCWLLFIADRTHTTRPKQRTQVLLSALMSTSDNTEEWILAALEHISHDEDITLTAQQKDAIMRFIQTENGYHKDDLPSAIPIAENYHDIDHISIPENNKLRKMKVVELRSLLRTLGIETSGVKTDLIIRLCQARDRDMLKAKCRAQGVRKKRRLSVTNHSIKSTNSSLILILDAQLINFPWEGLNVFRKFKSVSRMPSLELTLSSMELHDMSRIDHAAIDSANVGYILNPGGDLLQTESRIGSILRHVGTWDGLIGQAPTEKQWMSMLLHHELLVYCGHGAGERYFQSDRILKLKRVLSAILLFGCSSGRVKQEGIFGPDGAVISYLRVGSPCVLAMLWDVTDKDVDRLSLALITDWLLKKPTESLSSVLERSRRVCKLQHLNGLAAVCYGLPVHVALPKNGIFESLMEDHKAQASG